MTKIADIRTEYKLESLDIEDVKRNPMEQFHTWFNEALKAEVIEPNAMFLATVSASGQPTGRIVLLKGIEEGGFVFYTNYNSRKGGEIAHNELVSLTFFWANLERQVRIEGKALKVSEETSTNYFLSRPRDSQIGAWASPQSQPVANKEALNELFEKYKTEFSEKPLVKPSHWGGYVVIPHYLEFWQGRPSRMHDRICYTLEGSDWLIQRIAP